MLGDRAWRNPLGVVILPAAAAYLSGACDPRPGEVITWAGLGLFTCPSSRNLCAVILGLPHPRTKDLAERAVQVNKGA